MAGALSDLKPDVEYPGLSASDYADVEKNVTGRELTSKQLKDLNVNAIRQKAFDKTVAEGIEDKNLADQRFKEIYDEELRSALFPDIDPDLIPNGNLATNSTARILGNTKTASDILNSPQNNLD